MVIAKPLNSGNLRVLKNLSIIERYPQLGGDLKRLLHLGINLLSAIHGMSAFWDVRYWEFHCTRINEILHTKSLFSRILNTTCYLKF